MKSVVKMVVWIIVVLVLSFAGFVLYISLVDFKPAEIEDLIAKNDGYSADKINTDTLELICWNIGYGGLGAEMDFFYDGGKKVRPTPELSEKYLKGIKKTMAGFNSDFILLQEVDVKSKRSYSVDQVSEIEKLMTQHYGIFALNYKVPFVPVPMNAPMGKVKGGMLSLSKFKPASASRHAYPLIASWPDRLFLLDRCFILTRFPVAGSENQLVVLNTHNSAYVYDAVLRNKELEIIRRTMIDEYAKGNFVIAGGDWNANPRVLNLRAALTVTSSRNRR